MTANDVNIATLMQEMDESAAAIERASNRLYALTREFDGIDEEGELGIRLSWEALIQEEATRIYDEYEQRGERPPPEKVREQRAFRIAREMEPELFHSYHKLKTERDAIQKWLAAYRDAISARQSVLSAEKAMLGMPAPGPQPEWSGNQ